MTYPVLLVVIVLASWALVNTATSLLVCAWWKLAADRIACLASGQRKRLIFTARTLPVAMATFVALLVVWRAFHRFEPRDAGEAPGWILWTAALVACALVLRSTVSTIAELFAIRRFRQACERAALPIEIETAAIPVSSMEGPFPVVAVPGLFRPRLFIARRVVEACDDRELATIVAHEESHVRRFDNIGRLIVECAPDFVGALPSGRSLCTAWRIASEDAADDDAAASVPGGRLDLASALVRVAQLAVRTPPHLLASSLLSAGPVERRVRRLLNESTPVDQTDGLWRWFPVFSLATIVVSTDSVLRAAHRALELAVVVLP